MERIRRKHFKPNEKLWVKRDWEILRIQPNTADGGINIFYRDSDGSGEERLKVEHPNVLLEALLEAGGKIQGIADSHDAKGLREQRVDIYLRFIDGGYAQVIFQDVPSFNFQSTIIKHLEANNEPDSED